jgi:fucose 4-O-acetylase-like acetyltransferase
LASTPDAGRLLFIDNIRWTLIVIVICHHAGVTYSHVGDWYYMDGAQPGPVTTLLMGAALTFDQAYFMGFLFLIAGYFVPRAFESKGPALFLRDRAARLGIPSLVYMFLLHPFIVHVLLRYFDARSSPSFFAAYPDFVTSGAVLGATGPMWFAVALLLFSTAYACIRIATRGGAMPQVLPVPTHAGIAAIILLIAACTFLVRMVQPIGTSFLNMQFCFFSQYVVLFALGIVARRGDWFARLPRQLGLTWLRVAILGGVPAWFLLVAMPGIGGGNVQALRGGMTWQSAAYSLWESFFCLGVCLGLTVLFRDHFNRQGRFAAWMSRNSFSAYLFHPPLLIAVTLGLKPLAVGGTVKFVLACMLAVPLTFLVSAFLRPRLPVLRNLL